jgi:polynucleotide 5'-kinase involved in rRNA processing
MSSSKGLRTRRLEERLRAARVSHFVRRSEELAVFHAALAGCEEASALLFVHGPGGAGKSALLRWFADKARAAARPPRERAGCGA